MRKLSVILVAAFITACASTDGNKPAEQKPPATATAGVLTTATGMTLYTFDRDVAGSGKSQCYGECAYTWLPLLAKPDAKPTGAFTVIPREGGEKQWAYKGKPLYTFVGDVNPGDNSGKGVNGVWMIAKP
jgi:predicted lipoprotein with Yx(FWY)xxD motif